jgi:hypothetical protein
MNNNHRTPDYPDAETMRREHQMISETAQRSADIEKPYQTVAYKHLIRISQSHAAVAYVLENIILAYFIARAQEGES